VNLLQQSGGGPQSLEAVDDILKKKRATQVFGLKLLVESESAAKLRERYDSQVTDTMQKTARLKFRESAHQIIRDDRD
jgi:hypothetical protein